jgi:hypothetical protein
MSTIQICLQDVVLSRGIINAAAIDVADAASLKMHA